jgi:hypothetical protein
VVVKMSWLDSIHGWVAAVLAPNPPKPAFPASLHRFTYLNPEFKPFAAHVLVCVCACVFCFCFCASLLVALSCRDDLSGYAGFIYPDAGSVYLRCRGDTPGATDVPATGGGRGAGHARSLPPRPPGGGAGVPPPPPPSHPPTRYQGRSGPPNPMPSTHTQFDTGLS